MTLKDNNGTWTMAAKIVATIIGTFLSTATLLLMIITPLLSGMQTDLTYLKEDLNNDVDEIKADVRARALQKDVTEIKLDVRGLVDTSQKQSTDIAVIKEQMENMR